MSRASWPSEGSWCARWVGLASETSLVSKTSTKEIDVSWTGTHDPQLTRLADAIAQRVGTQRFHVWFHNSTRLDLKQDGLEIAVPNDFISEWIGTHFSRPIQEAAHEVLGCSLAVRFSVVPQLFELERKKNAPTRSDNTSSSDTTVGVAAIEGYPTSPGTNGNGAVRRDPPPRETPAHALPRPQPETAAKPVPIQIHTRSPQPPRQHHPGHAPVRLRHELATYIVGPSNHLAYNAATHVAEFPGVQYNPLFVHGACGLGKTHLLQGLCRSFIHHHPTKRWMYLTGEDFTNEFLLALRSSKLDQFRRKMRDLDLLVIDDVHFLGGKKATQEEFLHTFNAIEAMGRQLVIASDAHPKQIDEFGESLINRFVSGMVVRVDPPNFATRCEILRGLLRRNNMQLSDDVIGWIARRVTQNVRELEGAMTRIGAHVKLTGRHVDIEMVQQAMGDLDRQMIAPVKPENILTSVCNYFSLEMKDLMSGRRQRTISLARSLAMFLIRRTAKLSFPEIGMRMGKRNHSTVISACRRMEKAVEKNEKVVWNSSVGEREEESAELVQRLEELSRSMN